MYLQKDKRNTDSFLKKADLEDFIDIVDTQAYHLLLTLIHAIESDMKDSFMRVSSNDENADRKLLVERAKIEGAQLLINNLEAELRKIKNRLSGK